MGNSGSTPFAGEWFSGQAKLVLPENLDIEILPKLIKQGGWLSLPVKEVDFSQVKKADSAILSVLLLWAQAAQNAIKVTHFPSQLQTLVELYDMHTVIDAD